MRNQKHVNRTINEAWKLHVQGGADQPWMASLRLQFGERLLRRVQHHYQTLISLPRRVQQRLCRKWAMSLAAAALLLALAGAPAGMHIHAAPISESVHMTYVQNEGQTFRLGQVPQTAAWPASIGANPAPVSPGAPAATIVVNGNNPTTDCILADAIIAANTDTATGNCAAGTGADVLDIQVDVALTAPTPTIASEMTIVGNNNIIAGNGTFGPLLSVTVSGDMTLNDATVTNGYNTSSFGGGIAVNGGTAEINNSTISNNYSYFYGGGISNENGANLTVNDSVITGNTAGAVGGGILNHFSTATINNSTISDNQVLGYGFAGGIRNVGGSDMAIVNSTISGNTGFGAAGISNPIDVNLTAPPYLRIDNSTISGNAASYVVGGIDNVAGATLVINNSTLSGNNAASAYGGAIANGYYFPTYLTINDTTITGNSANAPGGGIWNSLGEVEINRSIVSGNSGVGSGAEIFNYDTVTADNFNLFGHDDLTTTDAFYGFTPGATDISATSDGTLPSPLTLILNTTLQDNGGDTETHALPLASPALDGVIDGSCAPGNIDQRFLPRGNGAGMGGPLCDIGAFELQTQSPTDVNLTDFSNDNRGGWLVGAMTALLAAVAAAGATLRLFRKKAL